MKKFLYSFLTISIIINIYLNVNKIVDTPECYIFWSNCLFWLHLCPLFYYIIEGYKTEIFPFLGILGLFLLFSYSLPPFFIRPTSYQLGTLSVESMKWSFWGYFSFYFFYFFILKSGIIKLKFFDPVKVGIYHIKTRHSAFIFLTIWSIDKFLLTGTSLHHIALISIYIYLGTYLTIINFKIRISTFEKLVFYAVLIYELTFRLFDGLLVLIALLTLFLVIIDFYTKKNITRILLISIPLFFAFSIISPIKSEFRELVWFSGQYFSPYERIEIIGDLYENYQASKNEAVIKSEEELDKKNFFWRYSYQASAFSLVLQETPKNIPFWNGESYQILSKIIPRFIWENKPTENMGYKFGTRYRIIDHTNTNTSMNTPILTEMYINFGFFGIITGMFLLAIVYVFLNLYLNNLKTSIIGKVYCIAFLFPFVNHESNFTLAFGNIPLLILSILVISDLYINKKKNYYKI